MTEFKEMLNKCPPAILEECGLQDLPAKLAGFTRMPRKANMRSILEALAKATEAAEKRAQASQALHLAKKQITVEPEAENVCAANGEEENQPSGIPDDNEAANLTNDEARSSLDA